MTCDVQPEGVDAVSFILSPAMHCFSPCAFHDVALQVANALEAEIDLASIPGDV